MPATLLSNLYTVLTGGTNLVAPFKSTEYVSADGTITMGPNMPEPIDEHCSVNLDEGRSMLITGETQIYLFYPIGISIPDWNYSRILMPSAFSTMEIYIF